MSDFSRLMELALAVDPVKAQEAMGVAQMPAEEEKPTTPPPAAVARETERRR